MKMRVGVMEKKGIELRWRYCKEGNKEKVEKRIKSGERRIEREGPS